MGGTGFRGVEEVFWAAARHRSMLGQLAFQYQAVTGAVDVSTTPVVEYTYSSPANGSRITSMVYPNGRTIDYNYSGTNLNSALDNAIGRLDSISDGANSGDVGQVLEQYSYLGLSTIVTRNHPQTGINLTYLGSSGSIGSGGDQYVGLDQFGRVVNQNWVNSSGATVDGYTYSYDANGNVTAKNNALDSAYSQTFTYDQLNRLASSTQGGSAYQSWSLDSQGNWSSFTNQGSTQTETANAQNQITSISGQTTPTYDANGNMTSGSLTSQPAAGVTMVYNAWNQLVEVKNAGGAVIVQYSYNALGQRTSESYPVAAAGIPAGTVKYLYYSASSIPQVIEERWNGTASNDVQYQYVWSASYVNAMILRDTYSGGTLQANSRIYTTYDVNYNVTSLVGYNSTTQSWGVVERFDYTPYGTVTVLSPSWTAATDAYNWQYMYQGGREDPITGLYHFDHRDYSTSLGVWTSQDPDGYINGANKYQFVESSPVNWVDPSGQSVLGAIGGVVGGAIGAVLGALGGGAAGTAVEPGGGTVIGTGLGGYDGAVTGATIGAGAGIIAGNALHDLGGLLWHLASRSNPFKGKPGSTSSTQTSCGKPKQDRRYGPDGYPETDVDHDHDHGQGQPHAHDWGRPSGGGPPTATDRGPGRPVRSSDP